MLYAGAVAGGSKLLTKLHHVAYVCYMLLMQLPPGVLTRATAGVSPALLLGRYLDNSSTSCLFLSICQQKFTHNMSQGWCLTTSSTDMMVCHDAGSRTARCYL
eukprot:GHUV01053311.1.p1 GENE.GHUV01053311.1~~GHUV01053311.1.p1  ORF type:complete len:103 (+),score=32.69 GHUV01053311.1:540-848(+)